MALGRHQTNFIITTLILSCMFLAGYAQNACQLPLYHMANLTQRTWKFEGNSSHCLPTNKSESECIFFMKLCSPLTIDQKCSNASVCESLLNIDTNFKLAGYTDYPFVQYTDPSQGFTTGFPSGELYNHTNAEGKFSMCHLQTIINFSCKKDKPWVPEGDPNTPQNVPYQPVQIQFNLEKCLYNITFEFSGACLTTNPSITISNTLSAGSVLVILFFVFTLAYFVFGSMWNIGCRGARGKEVIPNLDFWTMLPVYVADGVLFTFRCGQMEASSYDSI